MKHDQWPGYFKAGALDWEATVMSQVSRRALAGAALARLLGRRGGRTADMGRTAYRERMGTYQA